MQLMYCWRCCEVVPMLDEAEFKIVADLYSAGMKAFGKSSIEHRFRPCRDAYERITGYQDMHENAIMHHRLSLYGRPCPDCGKPFRSPQATRCVETGCPPEVTNA